MAVKLSGSVAAAEETREAQRHKGFGASLYQGAPQWDFLNAFGRTQSASGFQKYAALFAQSLKDTIDPDQVDRTGEIPSGAFSAFRALKAFALKIPAEYGGVGLTQSDYQDLAVLMGSWCGSTTALISANNSLGASETLKRFGTDEQKQRWWTRLATGSISGLALTERDAGCDVWNQQATAVPVMDGERLVGYQLYGRKQYTTNIAKTDTEFLADILVVDARLPDAVGKGGKPRSQFGAFIVDTARPGIKLAKRNQFMGLRGMYNGDVLLEGVFVPACDRVRDSAVKGENDGLVIALKCITTGRMTLPAAAAGGLKRALNIARQWAGQRVQMGKPIRAYQHIAEKVVRIASRVFALEAMVKLNGIWTDEHGDLRMESVASKVLGTEWLTSELRELFYIRGGRGYETTASQEGRNEPVWGVERMLRDAPINEVFEGDNRVLTLSYAREGNADLIDLANGKMSAFGRVAKAFLRSCNPLGDFIGGGSLPAGWSRFIKRRSRLLMRKSLMTFLRYQLTLQDKNQLELMQIAREGMNLLAAGAALAYAQYLKDTYGNEQAVPLAEWFCRDTLGLGGTNKRIWPIARQILDGKATWLESGIV